MKMTKFAGICVAVIAILSLAMFVSCGGGGGGGGAKSSAKVLSTITVAGEAPDAIPTPISEGDWFNEDYYPSEVGTFTLPNAGALTSAAIVATASPGATASWGIDKAYDRLQVSFGRSSTLNFEANDFLYVQVVAQDGSKQFYRFTVTTASANVNLSTLVIGGEAAPRSAYGPEWNDITGTAIVGLSPGVAQNATVVATTSGTGAKVRYAHVAKANATDAPTFTGDPLDSATASSAFNLGDEDIIYVEVNSADGSQVRIYKVVIEVGRNANLASIAIDTTPQDSTGPDSWLGTPANTWAAALPGDFQTDRQIAALGGLGIKIVPEDSFVTDPNGQGKIEYFLDGPSATLLTNEPTWVDYPSAGIPVQMFDLEGTYYLYVKVTAYAGGSYVMYYKTKLVFPATGKIVYGQPELVRNNQFYYDTDVWDDPDVYTFVINRPNKAENPTGYFYDGQAWGGQHTTAIGKAVWDNDGIYVYVDATTKQYRETEGGALKDRPIALANVGSDHQGDSVEVFVNERLQVTTGVAPFRDMGNQFRIGADGRLTARAGPETGAARPAVDAWIANATANGQAVARLKADGGVANSAHDGGYEVLLFVPFTWTEDLAASDVFANGSVKDLSTIGFELQLNTGVVDNVRDGILTWNGVMTQSYGNASGYGEVVLDLNGKTAVVNAQRPTIDTQPVGAAYTEGDTATALTVVASTTQTGSSLSYQWYKAATGVDTDEGTPVGTNSASYLPVIDEVETWYYYVVVTNTNNTVDGVKTRSVTSNRVAVAVLSAVVEPWLERILVTGASAPIYGFDIPTDKTFADYDRITAQVKLIASSRAQSRYRAWGLYDVNGSRTPDMGNGTGTGQKLLSNDENMENNPPIDTWTSVSFVFNGKHADYATVDALENGLVGIAFTLVAGGGDGTSTVKYLVKDIVLSNTNGSVTVPALRPDYPLLWGGQGTTAWVIQGGSGPVTRELFGDESEVPPEVQLPPDPPGPFVVDLSSQVTKNAAAISAENATMLTLDIVGAGNTVLEHSTTYTYAKIVFTLKFYDESETLLTAVPPYGNLQYNFLLAGASVVQNYNFGASGTIDPSTNIVTYTISPLPTGNFDGFRIVSSNGTKTAQYVEVLSVSVTGP